MKKIVVPRSSPVPDLDALDDLVSGTTLPAPDLEGSLSKVMIGAFTVKSIDDIKESRSSISDQLSVSSKVVRVSYPDGHTASCQRHPSMQRNDRFLPCCCIVDGPFSI